MRTVLVLLLAASCEKAAPPAPPPPPPPPPAPLDLVLVVDLSRTMMDTDIPPDRLAATKLALAQLVAASPRDRIGLVLYAQEAALWVPLGGPGLADRLGKLDIGDVPDLATAAGDGLALAVDQLRGSKRKAIVMVGDGESNWVKRYDPAQAAGYAKQSGIAVHTIMVGNDVPDPGYVGAESKTLREIAGATGGTFAKATTPQQFADDIAAIRKRLDQ